VKILLDIHVFLWIIHEPEKLSKKVRGAVVKRGNELYLSAASYWEICIKHSLGKLGLLDTWAESFDQEMSSNHMMWLPIAKKHCQAIVELPDIHKDPFDRLLVAQAKTEDMTILTVDPYIPRYEVKTLR
jgi:PIN domain nuclease of toxin-antitoxin system